MDSIARAKLTYSVPGLAVAASVGKSKLWSEIAAGKLRAFKLGSRTLISAEDAAAWLDQYRKPQPQRAA
jgi:hypothetical protein